MSLSRRNGSSSRACVAVHPHAAGWTHKHGAGSVSGGIDAGRSRRDEGADGVQEWPVALVALEDGSPAIEPGGAATAGTIDRDPVEFRLVTTAQRAGDGDVVSEPWPAAPALDVEPPPSRDLDAVIHQRGSTRLMDARATVPRAAYEFALASALRGIEVPHYIAVHGVEGVEPGPYRWARSDVAAAPRGSAPRVARGLLGPGPPA